jgi:hypothetical protein
VAFGGYYAKTETGRSGKDSDSYQGRFDYSPDLYGRRQNRLAAPSDRDGVVALG